MKDPGITGRNHKSTVTRPGSWLESVTSPPGEEKEVEESKVEEDEKKECSQDFINSLEIKDFKRSLTSYRASMGLSVWITLRQTGRIEWFPL